MRTHTLSHTIHMHMHIHMHIHMHMHMHTRSMYEMLLIIISKLTDGNRIWKWPFYWVRHAGQV